MKKILCIFLFIIFFTYNLDARQIWYKGQVTRPAWQDNNNYIEVDNIKFLIMPKSKFGKLIKRDTSFVYQNIDLYSIYTGDNVNMKVEGMKIYEIQVTPD